MKFYFLILMWFGISVPMLAQTTGNASATINLASVALLDIEPAGTISLNFTPPTEAGAVLGSSSSSSINSTKWINITSAVTTGLTRRVTAQISGGTLPNGVRLSLAVANPVGGAGTRGTPVALSYLTTSAQTIINSIGGAYTTSGSGSGFNLTYALDIQTYSVLKSGTSTFSILYTLVDN
jgi:hypothetical protein